MWDVCELVVCGNGLLRNVLGLLRKESLVFCDKNSLPQTTMTQSTFHTWSFAKPVQNMPRFGAYEWHNFFNGIVHCAEIYQVPIFKGKLGYGSIQGTNV